MCSAYLHPRSSPSPASPTLPSPLFPSPLELLLCMPMGSDECDYLGKAIEPSEFSDAECKEKERGDEGIHEQNERSRKSRASEQAGNWRHERPKDHNRSKKTRVFDDDAERSDRDGFRSERSWQEEKERLSHDNAHDGDRRKHGSREMEMGHKDWNVRDGERKRGNTSGGWHRVGISGGRARVREDRHLDKDGGKEISLTEPGTSRHSRNSKGGRKMQPLQKQKIIWNAISGLFLLIRLA